MFHKLCTCSAAKTTVTHGRINKSVSQLRCPPKKGMLGITLHSKYDEIFSSRPRIFMKEAMRNDIVRDRVQISELWNDARKCEQHTSRNFRNEA